MLTGQWLCLLKAIFHLNVDERAGFEIVNIHTNQDLPQNGGDSLLDYEEIILAFQCNAGLTIIVPPPINQGDEFEVWLQVNDANSMLTIDFVHGLFISNAYYPRCLKSH